MHHGIKGMVYDENSNPISNAEISVAGVNHDVTNGKKSLASVNYHHAHVYTLSSLLSLVKDGLYYKPLTVSYKLYRKQSANVIS